MNLDLDALEREQKVIKAYPWWSEPETPRTDPDELLALIAELRARRAVMRAVATTLRDAGFRAVAATLEDAYVEAASLVNVRNEGEK